MNPMKNIAKRNTTWDNVSYLIDENKCLCQCKNVYPLTARKGKWVPETMHRNIEKNQPDPQKYTTPEREEKVNQLRN